MCFDTLSDELNMQTSRLPRRLMDYITYGFFESNKNKANQKVHQKKNKKKSIPVCDQRYCLCYGEVRPVSSVCWLNVCTARVKGVELLPFGFKDSEQVPVLNGKMYFL